MARMYGSLLFKANQIPRSSAKTKEPLAGPILKIEQTKTSRGPRWTITGPTDNVCDFFDALEAKFRESATTSIDRSLPENLQREFLDPVSRHANHMMGDPYILVTVKGLQCSITGDHVAMSLEELKEMAADPKKNITTQILRPPSQEMVPVLASAAAAEILIYPGHAVIGITSRNQKTTALVEALITAHVADELSGRI